MDFLQIVYSFPKYVQVHQEKIQELRAKLEGVCIAEIAQELQVGELTLKDIISELGKPGRDPSEDMPTIFFSISFGFTFLFLVYSFFILFLNLFYLFLIKKML